MQLKAKVIEHTIGTEVSITYEGNCYKFYVNGLDIAKEIVKRINKGNK